MHPGSLRDGRVLHHCSNKSFASSGDVGFPFKGKRKVIQSVQLTQKADNLFFVFPRHKTRIAIGNILGDLETVGDVGSGDTRISQYRNLRLGVSDGTLPRPFRPPA